MRVPRDNLLGERSCQLTRVESTWEGSLEMVKLWRLGDPKGRVGPERGVLPPTKSYLWCVRTGVEDGRINSAALDQLSGNSVVFRAVRWPWEGSQGTAALPLLVLINNNTGHKDHLIYSSQSPMRVQKG